MTASFEKGALKFANTSVGADGNAGYDISIEALNETSATALGISKDATTIKPLGEGNTENTYKAGTFAYAEKKTPDSAVTGATKLTDLGIAENTVKQHIRHMMEKSGCKSRTELAIEARISGVVIPLE